MTPDPIPTTGPRRTAALPRLRFLRNLPVMRHMPIGMAAADALDRAAAADLAQVVEADHETVVASVVQPRPRPVRHASTVGEMRQIIAAQAKRDRKASARRQQ